MIGATVLQQLKDEINAEEYERYIKQLKYNEKHSKSDFLVYEAPNQIMANWIKTKYAKKIASIYESIIKIKPKVEIVAKKSNQVLSAASKKQTHTNKPSDSLLNPSFTFENFIVGGSNQFAYTAAKNVAEQPGINYNPFLIYGGTGLGKTHLLQAIGNHNIKLGKNVIYVTSEQFMNDLITNIKSQTQDRFREKYRYCDILLIDDVQFFGGKDSTQEEFFHTFNELHGQKKQIVLTADKPPKKIAHLEERLRSRFEWGLSADVKLPELETKIGIIQKKCELNKIDLNSEIINYIASNLGENIREIESAIIRINAFSNMLGKPIDIAFAKEVLKETIKDKNQNVNIDTIINIVSKEMNIKPSEIKSKSRHKNIADARRIVIYLARHFTPNSMPTLALYFNMKDHSTVSHSMKKMSQLINDDANYKLFIEELINKIGSKAQP